MNLFKSKSWNQRIMPLCFVFFMISCKTKETIQSTAAKEKEVVATTQQTAYPTEPGTCIILAYIINILSIDTTINEEPCQSFPCNAQLIITKSSSCGFGVQRKPTAGDTLDVKFIHSLASSQEFKKVYPAKVVLPGLKQDQLFEAQIKIKMLPMDKFAYEIGNYELVR